MKRRILATVLALCLVLGLVPGTAWAAETASGKCGEDATWTLDSSGVLTISGTGSIEDYTKVWDKHKDDIKQVVVNEGITAIGGDAFSILENLTSVSLPDSLVAIGDGAFSGCSNLRTITIPHAVKTIGISAFQKCTSLKNFSIPKGITSIKNSTFMGCTALESISIPDSVTYIEFWAFAYCQSLKNVTIPESVTGIEETTFFQCPITSIFLPASLESIEDGTFLQCSELKEILVDSGNKKFTSKDGVLFSKDMTELLQYPENRGGSSYSIPDGVRTIKKCSFANCREVTSLHIPSSVMTIEYSAFDVCKKLNDVYYDGTRDMWNKMDIDEESGTIDGNSLLAAQLHFLGEAPSDEYSFTYDLNGGTTDSEIHPITDARPGDILNLWVEPVRPGYTFVGWSDGTKTYKLNDSYPMPDHDVVMKAVWKKNVTPELPSATIYNNYLDLAPGETAKLDYKYTPADAIIKIFSDDESIVTVSGDTIRAIKPGATRVYLTATVLDEKGKPYSTATGVCKITIAVPTVRYVQNLTETSLRNADEETKATINTALSNLLFKAQYRPTESKISGDTAPYTGTTAVIKTWPIQNKDPFGSSVTDSVLGKVKFAEGAAGCMAYALFSTAYVYGTSGTARGCSYLTETGITNFIHTYADPGEQLRYTHKGGIHSIVFLGESTDGAGFYYISYEGGAKSNGAAAHYLYVSYQTYTSFAKKVTTSLTVRDANRGSYWAGTAKSAADIREGNGVTRMAIHLACPVEASIRLGNEVLDSRNLGSASFGTVQSVDGEIVFDLDYKHDYELTIDGTGSGTMDVTLAYYADDALVDTRKMIGIPVSNAMVMESSSFDPNASFVLYDKNDSTGENTWGVGIGESVSVPDESYSSINNSPEDINSEEREDTSYISIPSFSHGTITPTTRNAAPGDRVTLYAHPDAGYELDTLTVKDIRGRSIPLRSLGDNAYSFTMPNARVTVDASFVKTASNDTPASTPAEEEPFTGLGTPGISGIVLNPAVMPFTDVKSTDWFYDNVDYVWKHYLMSGVSGTQFAPDITTSRAMIWTILARMNNVRTDINPGSTWYERGMLWGMEQGVTDGTNPMADITREQLATMLWRNAGRPAPGAAADLSRFSDSDTVSEYAQTAVRWAASVGILNGSDGKIDPQGTATRAQVAAMVARYGDRVA